MPRKQKALPYDDDGSITFPDLDDDSSPDERITDRMPFSFNLGRHIDRINQASLWWDTAPQKYIQLVEQFEANLTFFKREKRFKEDFAKLNQEFLDREKGLSYQEQQKGIVLSIRLEFAKRKFALLHDILFDKGMLGNVYVMDSRK